MAAGDIPIVPVNNPTPDADIVSPAVIDHVQEALSQFEQKGAYGVTLIPYHVHNLTDAPPIDKVLNGIPLQLLNTTSTPQFARLGLGQAADSGAVLGATGQIGSFTYTTTTTVSFNSGNSAYIRLANGVNTFTFSNPKNGFNYKLFVQQPSSGAAGTIVWPATVAWTASDGTPAPSTANSKLDLFGFTYEGTNSKYLGYFKIGYL